MPKAFSEKEKAAILKTLMDKGLKRFAKAGVRAVRIDDICRDAGISKGSFYSFFTSKEDLFMTIANARDHQHKADMHAFLQTETGDAITILSAFFNFLMARISTDPALRIVRDSGEVQHLLRKVSPNLIAENMQRDKQFVREIAEIFYTRHAIKHADADTLEGLMTLMVSLELQVEHLTIAGTYTDTVALLRDMFISRLLKGPVNDRS